MRMRKNMEKGACTAHYRSVHELVQPAETKPRIRRIASEDFARQWKEVLRLCSLPGKPARKDFLN
jgi:hypothetical protein